MLARTGTSWRSIRSAPRARCARSVLYARAEAITAWLASCGVTKVAMESTSVYWIPVYETLERAGFEVMLAHHG